ncbi:acylphosphatase [Candidatus Micrarchaeota archaeon]|nr:acylphosphatase [Candidatus Micrarchaeota archaeon]
MGKRIHLMVTGVVQGVGFRFAVRNLADSIRVNGFVRNVSDGRVEIVAEGREEVLKRMIEEIRNFNFTHVKKVEEKWEETKNEFNEFEIRY